MPRIKILHLIDSLGVGGAETLLANTIPLLSDYEHVICYLSAPDTLQDRFPTASLHCLDHGGWRHLPRTVRRLTTEIERHEVGLVHSHLMLSTWIARLAVPRRVRLVSTLHNILSKDAFDLNPLSLLAERLTIGRSQSLVAVSRTVLEDYERRVPFPGKTFVVYNFIPDRFFKPARAKRETGEGTPLRCVSIGNLRDAKNHEFTLRAFETLRDQNIHLDIYGDGPLRGALQAQIDRHDLRVTLKGIDQHIDEALERYDVFISSSFYEGCPLTVVEAMASGLPTMLSDIPVLREISGGHALFFPLEDPRDLSSLLVKVSNGSVDIQTISERGRARADEVGRRERYQSKLASVYDAVLQDGPRRV